MSAEHKATAIRHFNAGRRVRVRGKNVGVGDAMIVSLINAISLILTFNHRYVSY